MLFSRKRRNISIDLLAIGRKRRRGFTLSARSIRQVGNSITRFLRAENRNALVRYTHFLLRVVFTFEKRKQKKKNQIKNIIMIEGRFCRTFGANPPTTGRLLLVVKPALVEKGEQVTHIESCSFVCKCVLVYLCVSNAYNTLGALRVCRVHTRRRREQRLI